MNTISLSALFSLLILSSTLYAQFDEPCYSDILHQHLLDSDPQYAQYHEQLNQLILAQTGSDEQQRINNAVYTIPVVVHVLHVGEAVGTGSNISLAQINSAIDNLNDAFQNIGYNGVDMEIQFALATQAPDETLTDGINRINASATANYGTNGLDLGNEAALKALSYWPANQYLNIWSVTSLPGSLNGFAYLSVNVSNPSLDGIVQLYDVFGYDPDGTNGFALDTDYRNNSVTIHEAGHYCGLYHTFQGGCPETDCSMQGDLVCDTQAHTEAYGVCPFGGTDADPACTDPLDEVVYNFMSYYDDDCIDRFTAGQKTRARAGLLLGRPGIVNSLAFDSPITKPSAVLTCQPTTVNPNNFFSMGIAYFQLNEINYYSYGTNDDDAVFNGDGYVETWAQATLMAGETYSPLIENAGPNSENVKVYIDYNNNGDFSDSGEMVFSSESSTSHSGSFTVPVTATPTEVWVRVISDFAFYEITDPCYAPVYGQVEDYSALILAALPVDLTYFTGQKSDKAIALKWETQSETNSDFFTLERSANGVRFEELARINSKGTTTISQQYQWLDHQPLAGTNYYRLSQTDFDGTTNVFKTIVAVDWSEKSTLTVYPTIVNNNEMKLRYTAAKDGVLALDIYNASGQLVHQVSLPVVRDYNEIMISLSPAIQAGVYFLKAHHNNYRGVTRFVKQ